MELLIVPPAITESLWLTGEIERYKGDIFLTNPQYQISGLRCSATKPKKIITEMDICADDKFHRRIVGRATEIARTWFKNEEIAAKFMYRGINLAEIYTYNLSIYLIQVIKAVYVYDLLFSQRQPKKILLLADSTCWSYCAKYVAKEKNIIFIENSSFLGAERNFQHIVSLKTWGAETLREIMAMRNWFGMQRCSRGGILFSSALRFSIPLLRSAEKSYYLREKFSFEAQKLSHNMPFRHFAVPKCFAPRTPASLTKDKWRGLQAFFKKAATFRFDSYDLLEIVDQHYSQELLRNIDTARYYVDTLSKLLQTLKPRTVVVEEEVVWFNKILVLTAKTLGIKTICLIHGILAKDIGFIPSYVDRLCVWGRAAREILEKWGISAEKIAETGALQFQPMTSEDKAVLKNRILVQHGFSEDSLLVTLAIPPFDCNDRATFTSPEKGAIYQHDCLNFAINVLMENPKTCLFVKLRPGDQHLAYLQKKIGLLNEKYRARVHFLQNYPTRNLIAASDLVLVGPSTVYFDALIMRIPVVLLDYSEDRRAALFSEHFFDLSDRTSWNSYVKNLLSKKNVEQMLRDQEIEIARHFYDGNHSSIRNVLQQADSA